MARSGCRLREIGTTNRTHLSDYAEAIGPKTGLVMKVHTSNYVIEGFTAEVPEPDLAQLCRDRGVPFVVDLGSGTLVDLRQFGLPHEPTPGESIANGADLVTFSGDKLLGGPQAGIVVGRADLIKAIKRNPLKRALRVDKMTIAALTAVLRLYSNPERLANRLPVLRLLARPLEDIRGVADRIRDIVAPRLEGIATVETTLCASQIGSGALPTREIPSVGLAIRPPASARHPGAALDRIARAFRQLPIPVIGRIQNGALILDLRTLEDERSVRRSTSRADLQNDHRNRGARRSREDAAGESPHGRGRRSPAGRKKARHDDRSRLRLSPPQSGETIGFIDVPGHERFIHNMLAGVAGIDFVLFIIAADDGPMPQTREHLSILDLLGIRNGAVAITKIDRVAPSRVQEVGNEVAELFSKTTLAAPAIFPVSAVTGEGIDALKAHLLSAAREWRPKTTAGNFRLAIDRSFTRFRRGTDRHRNRDRRDACRRANR